MDKFSDFPGASAGWRCPFQPTACLHVTGEDALTFLQGQFTQELRSTAVAPVAYGLWLNQKGKVMADSFVLREAADSVWIISFSSSATVIRERLEAYVIADDVVVEEATETWSGLTVGGPEAEAWLTREAGGVPKAGEFFKVAEGGWVFRGRRGSEPSFEWVRPADAPVPAGLATVSAEAVERLRISAEIPRVPQDIGIGDLPNEGGLDETGISYTKGCYLGQEVMARLKAMGTVRRRLVRVRGAGCSVPAVPCALLQGEKRVGELRSAVSDGAGGFIGLAMITKLGLDPVAKLAPEPGGDGFIELVELP
ncbi:MAG TPA: folate-binding protein [Rariglobus sp.]|nr:folate-binding protein [Rariglobus sp.]